MSFQLPELKYAKDALEPHIDAKTMEIHHDKHHAGYTSKLNAAIEGTDLEGKTIENILINLDMTNKAVRNRLSARGIVVYLQTTIDKQVARTQRDKRRPLLQKGDPEQILRNLADERNPLYEEVADYIVDTDDQSARAVANQIISKIGL